jgi:membrane-bound ClpP family serine protease
MWIVAGVLLGLVILVTLAGFHTGPHAHVLAVLIGVALAAWLVLMAVDGRSAPLLWALLSADLVISAGVGVTAWTVLRAPRTAGDHFAPLESKEGVAVVDLVPEGIVRLRGEQWSAISVNGNVRAGTRVQVLRSSGVRLEVWGEEAETTRVEGIFELRSAECEEQST